MMYRRNGRKLEVFLVHPGGPFFARKDNGHWTIPKGEPDENEHKMNIVGIGQAESRGLRRGIVTTTDAVVESIKKAVEEAERVSGLEVHSATVNLSGEHLRGENKSGVVAVAGAVALDEVEVLYAVDELARILVDGRMAARFDPRHGAFLEAVRGIGDLEDDLRGRPVRGERRRWQPRRLHRRSDDLHPCRMRGLQRARTAQASDAAPEGYVRYADDTLVAAFREHDRPKLFFFNLALGETAVLGAFMAQDLALFIVFFDLMLVPFYFMIGGWGTGDRVRATTKFVIYTLAGSLLMLAAAVALGVLSTPDGGEISFSLAELQQRSIPEGSQHWIVLLFALAFFVKAPLFPLHGWVPETYRSTPIVVLALLSGVLVWWHPFEAWSSLAFPYAVYAVLSRYGSDRPRTTRPPLPSAPPVAEPARQARERSAGDAARTDAAERSDVGRLRNAPVRVERLIDAGRPWLIEVDRADQHIHPRDGVGAERVGWHHLAQLGVGGPHADLQVRVGAAVASE